MGTTPTGRAWLCAWAEPKAGETTPALLYAKSPINGRTFSFLGLVFGGAYKDTYSVGRTWKIFVAIATTDAAEKWLEEASAHPADYSFPAGNRSSPPPGLQVIGQPISVTRGA